MHCIDSIEQEEESLVVSGWFFKLGATVESVKYKDEETSFEIEGYGMPSEDLAAIFDGSLTNHRFRFTIQGARQNGLIEFILSDGSSEGVRLNVGQQMDKVVPLRHQIHDGIYRCRLKLKDVQSVQGVSLSKGDVLDSEAKSVDSFDQTAEGTDLIIEFSTQVEEAWTSSNLCVHIQLSTGEWVQIGNIPVEYRKHDPAHQVSNDFTQWINSQEEGLRILEIGSRARSGIVRKQSFSNRHEYLGMDVIDGENVDLVCDAHSMSQQIESNSIDAVISYAVFEHLAMPWKVVIEMNKVMKIGGRCMIFAPHTWPMHETPFDFWRFSDDSWRVLFNRATGFKLLKSACGEPSLIRPEIQMEGFEPFESAHAYLCTAVLAEKVSETQLEWDVPVEDMYVGGYPY